MQSMINECKKEDCLFTLVIPAYNVELFIEECLKSVVNQSFTHFRTIIIDDGSTDSTSQICQKYSEKYGDRMRYIYQENRGLGAARNAGLALADTKYVCFLDSDDLIEYHYFEQLYKLVQSVEEIDLIYTIPACFDSKTQQFYDWMDKKEFEAIFRKNDEVYVDTNVTKTPSLYLLEVNANRKVYRTEFLRSIQFAFPEGVKWEDIRPHFQQLHLAKHCVGLTTTGFWYRTNSSSQITSGRGKGRLDFISVFFDCLDCIEKENWIDEEYMYFIEGMYKYSHWMIEMTDTENIGTLLSGIHECFLRIDKKRIDYYSNHFPMEREELNKRVGFIEFFKTKEYIRLADYWEKLNYERFWSQNGKRRKNLVLGGIQCIKDSGLKYTLQLIKRKLLYQGF